MWPSRSSQYRRIKLPVSQGIGPPVRKECLNNLNVPNSLSVTNLMTRYLAALEAATSPSQLLWFYG
jgi:hypothetical protein